MIDEEKKFQRELAYVWTAIKLLAIPTSCVAGAIWLVWLAGWLGE